MNSAEARRLARQRKILANQEGRMNRIVLDQKFEPTNPEPAAAEAVVAEREPERLPRRIVPTEVDADDDEVVVSRQDEDLRRERVHGDPGQLVGTDGHSPDRSSVRNSNISNISDRLSTSATNVLKATAVPGASEEVLPPSAFQMWKEFILWFILGISVRLLLSRPDLSWLISDNALSVFVVVYLAKHLGFIKVQRQDPAPQQEQGGGLAFLALQMCGIKPTSIQRLKNLWRTISDVASAFSVYFVSFLIAHFVVQ